MTDVTRSVNPPFYLRAPCARCGGGEGRISERSGQACVYCLCGVYQYNAPKVETGQKRRSVSTREGITPTVRARVLATHNHACVSCGRSSILHGIVLQLDHLISRAEAERIGCLDELIDSEHNLAPMCEECNLGKRTDSIPHLVLIYRVLRLKAERSERS